MSTWWTLVNNAPSLGSYHRNLEICGYEGNREHGEDTTHYITRLASQTLPGWYKLSLLNINHLDDIGLFTEHIKGIVPFDVCLLTRIYNAPVNTHVKCTFKDGTDKVIATFDKSYEFTHPFPVCLLAGLYSMLTVVDDNGFRVDCDIEFVMFGRKLLRQFMHQNYHNKFKTTPNGPWYHAWLTLELVDEELKNPDNKKTSKKCIIV